MEDWLRTWSSTEFVADATTWVDAQARARGVVLRGVLEPVKVRFWAATFRVATNEGPWWFKALSPAMAHEPGLVRYLDRHLPGHVLSPVSVDVDRRWMLNIDGGQTLSERGDDVLDGLEFALQRGAALQLSTRGHADGLADAGLPQVTADDMEGYFFSEVERLSVLASDHPAFLDAATARELRSSWPHAARDVEIMRAAGVPSALQHNDLHGGNIFAPGSGHEGYRTFDWGDAVWSHPFALLRVPCSIARAGTMREGHVAQTDVSDPRIARLYRAYLTEFAEYGSVEDLTPVAQAADRLGRLTQYRVWAECLRDQDHAAIVANTDYLPDFATQLRKVVAPRAVG